MRPSNSQTMKNHHSITYLTPLVRLFSNTNSLLSDALMKSHSLVNACNLTLIIFHYHEIEYHFEVLNFKNKSQSWRFKPISLIWQKLKIYEIYRNKKNVVRLVCIWSFWENKIEKWIYECVKNIHVVTGRKINVSETLNISQFSLKLTRTGVDVIALYNLYSNEVKQIKKIKYCFIHLRN